MISEIIHFPDTEMALIKNFCNTKVLQSQYDGFARSITNISLRKVKQYEENFDNTAMVMSKILSIFTGR